MNNAKICVSICASSVSEFVEKIESAQGSADVIELRFDCLENDQRSHLLEKLVPIDAQYLFTLRPRGQGGRRDLTFAERSEFWERALAVSGLRFMVDIEAEPALLRSLSPNNIARIVSIHDFSGAAANVAPAWRKVSALAGDSIVKIAVTAEDAVDAIEIWKVLTSATKDGKDVIAFAMGEAGKWTRILGPAHGVFMTYAAPQAGAETAPGQITAGELTDLYRVRDLDRSTAVYGLIAGDTTYSLSPYLHNAAFKSLGSNSVFIPLQVRDLDSFAARMLKASTREVELNFRGFAVTNPHKRSVIGHLDHVDETALRIGAVNTVKVVGGSLHGFNTDADGFIRPLKARYGDLHGARAAILGAGGTAKACVYALKQEEANVTVFARDPSSAKELTAEFGIECRRLTINSDAYSAFDIVVNTTPLGTRGKFEHETIATAEQLHGVKLVYDVVYNPAETSFLREAGQAGADTLGGFDMLVTQAAFQQQIWTGEWPAVDEMAAAARGKLDEG